MNASQRKNQMEAKEILHAYRADEKQMWDEIRRKTPKGDSNRTGLQVALSAPAYFTMSEIDEFQRAQKDIAAWRSDRVKSFGDIVPEPDQPHTILLTDAFRVNIKKIQTIFDGRESVEAALRSPLPDSPPRAEDPPVNPDLESAERTQNILKEPERVFFDRKASHEELHRAEATMAQKSEETEENSDIESTDSVNPKSILAIQPDEIKEDETMESNVTKQLKTELDFEDSIRSQSKTTREFDAPEEDIRSTSGRPEPNMQWKEEAKTRLDCIPGNKNVSNETNPGKSLIPRVMSTSTSSTSPSTRTQLGAPQIQSPTSLLAASRKSQTSTLTIASISGYSRKSISERGAKISGSPSPERSSESSTTSRERTLKRVPLYSRQPTAKLSKEAGPICSNKYIPNLHKTRDGCERCLYWASPEEKDKFQARGHHLRIMMVRGGCNRECTIFPREKNECPVRLCKKCYFDTHRDGPSREEEEKLLWNTPFSYVV